MATHPNHIEITVKISAHEDLKIAQDMTIAKGQVISDRITGKTRLKAQQRQFKEKKKFFPFSLKTLTKKLYFEQLSSDCPLYDDAQQLNHQD